MNLKLFLCAVLCLGLSRGEAAAQKRAMTFEDFDSWNTISRKEISADGQYVALQLTPWRGDARVLLYDKTGRELAQYAPAAAPVFSNGNNYLLVTLKPSLAEVEALQLKKTKKENMPREGLMLRNLKTGSEERISGVNSFKTAPGKGEWLAYQKKGGDTLFVRSLDGKKSYHYAGAANYLFAPKAEKMAVILKMGKDSAALCLVDLPTGIQSCIAAGEYDFRQLAFDESGNTFAFLQKAKNDKTRNGYALYVSGSGKIAELAADGKSAGVPQGWILNDAGTVRFSKNGERIFFGTSPVYREKDTTVLAENRPDVQVWSWDEPVQYTQQLFEKEKDLNASFAAVYEVESGKITQLGDRQLPDIRLAKAGDAPFVLASTTVPYEIEEMWEGRSRADVYLKEMQTGALTGVLRGTIARVNLSPDATYLYWYQPQDSSWYTYSIADKKQYRLTTPTTFMAYDDENDVPDYPSSQGLAGWSKNDESVLLYDKYDIWKFHPKGEMPAVNLTQNGKERGITYRYKAIDEEEKFIDLTRLAFLSGFNQVTRGSGIYTVGLNGKEAPATLYAGDFKIADFAKAREADYLIYTKETFSEYPNVYLSDLSFKKPLRLSNANPQQAGIQWGRAQLVKWISLDGKPLEGVLYVPEDFDPAKKYPMIVSFYEKNSASLFSHRIPEPHRSTVDYHFYTSNGYLIFNPDIVYEDGYPGLSAYNCIMPGITALVQQGFVDKDRIAAQGHSWGGYQVAYLATRTNLFACIESGAPVVNMHSAYGGIRWGSGKNRSFQYEHQQSRIGGTLWEKPLQYVENSPLYYMDKVKTPILIMHNDQDGHVPWYQGIEYFVALKRLRKPVWMLNYTGEVHWPQRYANKVDFQKRMFGFFEHYLNGAPMPRWMQEGIPVQEKDFELKY